MGEWELCYVKIILRCLVIKIDVDDDNMGVCIIW